MRIHNSLRNNFLGVILFSILLLPTITFAKYDVKGDTAKNIDNYVNGAGFYSNPEARAETSDTNSKLINSTLFKPNQTSSEVDFATIQGLRMKLRTSGSTVATSQLDTQHVYSINTGEESIYVYDPNPNNDSTVNDQLIVGVATKDNRMYIPKNPPLKESKVANDSLGYIDADRGLPPGSTVERKNAYYNAQQDKIALDQQLADANQEVTDATNAYNGYTGAQGTPEQLALQNAMQQAVAKRDGIQAQTNMASSTLAALAATRASSATVPDDGSCGTIFQALSIKCVLFLGAKITNIVFKLVSFVAYIAGTLFDYSLELSINSAQFFKKLGVIEVTWSFIRDILNMSFIFILLWTAVQILIGSDAKYNAKQVLTKVIIVAILINFSLFAAKLMVDASNIVSLKIYEAMKSNSESADATISERVMNTVGLSTLYNISDIFKSDTTKVVGYCASDPGALITISVMGSIFLIILSLALGLAGILFLVRLVNIIFLFIKSPLWVWGYVLPGNPSISKHKDEWWAEMKHVMLFPIAYLFWMLVAVIIFEKLGTAKNTTGGLLSLICNAPTQQGTAGAGATISLVAIFCIVIIFMMKAIEYGVKHAAGGPNAIGNDFSKKWAGKFATAQTAMTKGLARKAGMATMGASIGATKVPLRAVSGLGYKAFGKDFKEGWSHDAYRNPSIYAQDKVANSAAWLATKTANNGLANFVGLTGSAAWVSDKLKDPKNLSGETRKQAEARVVKGAEADERARYGAIDKTYKILTEDEWKKKFPNATPPERKKHIDDMMYKRATALLGEGVVDQDNEKGIKDKVTGKTLSHFEVMRMNAIKEKLDDKGNITGYKLDESAMHDAITGIVKYHTTGEGAKTIDLKDTKKRGFMYRNKTAAARIKALSSETGKTKSKSQTKDSAQKEIEALQKKIQKADNLPEVKEIENAANSYTVVKDQDHVKEIRDLNAAIMEYNTATTASKKTAAQIKITNKKAGYAEYREKQIEQSAKDKNNLAKKIKALDEAENKPKEEKNKK